MEPALEPTLALMAGEAATRILGVLGFLVLLPLLVLGVALLGRRLVAKRRAQEFASEAKAGDDDDWLQRTISGGK